MNGCKFQLAISNYIYTFHCHYKDMVSYQSPLPSHLLDSDQFSFRLSNLALVYGSRLTPIRISDSYILNYMIDIASFELRRSLFEVILLHICGFVYRQ